MKGARRGTKGGRMNAYVRRKFSRTLATESRLLGAGFGLIALVLPWGSIITRDTETHATLSIVGLNLVDLAGAVDPLLSLTSLLFIAATVFALLEERAVIGQAISMSAMLYLLPSSLLVQGSLSDSNVPGQTVSFSFGLGALMGAISMAFLVISFFSKKGDRYPWMRSSAPPSEVVRIESLNVPISPRNGSGP